MIYQIVYVSEYSGRSPEEDLQSILTASRHHNPQLEVTGLLLFVRNSFIQVLEGEETTIRELYAKIAKDPRHTRLDILLEHQIPQRLFPDWSMAWMPISEAEFCRIAHIKCCDFETLSTLGNNIVSEILLNFAELQNQANGDGIAH